MHLDLSTLVFANLMLSAFTGAALLFYRANQKTYRGFKLWIAGIFSVMLLYLSMCLLQILPLWASIILVNFFAAMAFLFWLDGSLLFIKERRLESWFYLTPFMVMLPLLYFHFVRDSAPIRNLICNVYLLTLAWVTAGVYLSQGSSRNGFKLSRAVGILFLVEGGLLLVRTLLWLISPGRTLLDHEVFHEVYFLAVLLMNGGVVVGIMMMNSRRLENELIASREDLDKALRDLRSSITEVRVLSGLLPICSHCKRIRDDRGDWQQLEKFIRDRSQANFSHGICPDCLKKHYPDYDCPGPEPVPPL